MEVNGRKYMILYLTDRQIKEVGDFLGARCPGWVIATGNGNGPIVSFVAQCYGPPKVKKMYLTEKQRRELMAESGEYRDYVELKKELNSN